MAPTSITSTTTTPAEWEPHTAPTTTASPSSNANTTRTTPFGSTRTSLPDNSRRLKGHGDSATHLSENGKPVDILEVPVRAFQAAVLSSTEIPCPHCGKNHLWTSGDLGLAMRALHDSPEASRVLVEAGSATALL